MLNCDNIVQNNTATQQTSFRERKLCCGLFFESKSCCREPLQACESTSHFNYSVLHIKQDLLAWI